VTRWLDRRPLVRLFLGRFFESELMPPGVAQAQVVIWTLALLAAPPYLVSMSFAFKYGRVAADRLPAAMLSDQLLFITYAMMALGLVALVVWESVFPDRRDVRVLGVLPIDGRSQVLARVLALALVAGLYAVAVNLPGAVVFGITLWRYEVAADPVRGVGAHLLATMAGGLFTFFTLVVLQGLVLALAGRGLARRLALLLQALFVVVVLQALLFVPWLAGRVQAAFDGGPSAMAAFPPAWYLALYDIAAGAARPVPSLAAVVALGATAVAGAGAAALVAGSHRRLVRLALETPPGLASPRADAVRRLIARAGRVLSPDPVARAVAGFVARTILRSRTHLTLLATCVGIAAALALAGLVPLVVRFGAAAFDRPRPALLSVPLVFFFVLLGGLRLLLALPTELRASWVFKASAPADRLLSVVAGVRTVGLVGCIAPVVAVSALAALPLWGLRTAALHAAYSVTAGLALLEIVLFGVQWMPYTREYRMQVRSRMAWPVVVLAFSAYAYTLARLESDLLVRPRGLLVAVVVGLGLSALLNRIRAYVLAGPPGLTFEADDPEALFGGFGLSEGLAATGPGGPLPGPAVPPHPPARRAAD
jgi:hypothetical protein